MDDFDLDVRLGPAEPWQGEPGVGRPFGPPTTPPRHGSTTTLSLLGVDSAVRH